MYCFGVAEKRAFRGVFFAYGTKKFIGIIGTDSVNQRRFRTNHFGAGLRDCIGATYNI